MSDIDFQNGFICGMATRGLTRSGEMYKPNIWNDNGVFNYFYIDFKEPLEKFSLGMFLESIVLYDSESIPITNVEYVSPGVYKVFADISGKINGVTVINKKTTLLNFATGKLLPAFSTLFYVDGVANYVRKAYVLEQEQIGSLNLLDTNDHFETYFSDYFYNDASDYLYLNDYHQLLAYENIDISYWQV